MYSCIHTLFKGISLNQPRALTEEEKRLLRVSMQPEHVILDFMYSCVFHGFKFLFYFILFFS